jgi:hypothetical protein
MNDISMKKLAAMTRIREILQEPHSLCELSMRRLAKRSGFSYHTLTRWKDEELERYMRMIDPEEIAMLYTPASHRG